MGETACLSPFATDGSSANLRRHGCHGAAAAATLSPAAATFAAPRSAHSHFFNQPCAASSPASAPALAPPFLANPPLGPQLAVFTGVPHPSDDDQPLIPVIRKPQQSSFDGEQDDSNVGSGQSPEEPLPEVRRPSLWYEEEIDENLRWCFGLKRILHTGISKFQEIALLDTEPFGKVLTLDRKMQSAEKDEWVYHECLVHPALLLHKSPKKVFIMGGGEGSTAREALRHRSVRKVVMCDIDEEVVRFCSTHLTVNKEAFQSSRLHLVIDDARAELDSQSNRSLDIIVGDLADPMEGGPCYQLYSKGFYEAVVKPKLNHGGIFVTQAGPAGILSHKEVFTSIYNTLRHVFAHVVAYSAHVPSYADTWGWVMASDQPLDQISSDELDLRIKQRVKGDLRYLDGATLHAATILNKTVRHSLMNEKHVYTEDSARFVYGHGRIPSS